MTRRKQWIQSVSVGVDEETGALLVLPAGLSNANRVEMKPALPDSGQLTIDLGQVCHMLILSLPAGAACTYSLKGPADADSPDLDGSMLLREESPEGVDKLYVFTDSDQSAFKLSIRGW